MLDAIQIALSLSKKESPSPRGAEHLVEPVFNHSLEEKYIRKILSGSLAFNGTPIG